MTCAPLPQVVRNVAVPLSLVADKGAFGGDVRGDCLQGDLVLVAGRAARLVPCQDDGPPRLMVLPRLVEPHCHLDKCHTAGRLAAPVGSLADAIAAQAQDKRHWTESDLRSRIRTGLAELDAAGVGLARSHVDWDDDTPPPAWSVLTELAQETAPALRVQPAALADIRVLADSAASERVARSVLRAEGALGAVIIGQPECADGLRAMFRMADRFGLPLDFHVDEAMDPHLHGLEMIADLALQTGHAGPVLCGHASSLSTRGRGDRARVIDKLARAGIGVVTLPSTNLYLQDRGRGPGARRGIAPVAELLHRGVAVAVGVDNVCDAFCPAGRHDPLWALGLAVLVAQLAGPSGTHLPMITTTAARALGHDPVHVDGAALQDLLIVHAADTTALVASAPFPRRPLSAHHPEALA